ncbi:MAG: hypothetical protein ACYSUT_11475 [Planctomycetota bacterium]|jgi:hypothetical protein
MKKIVIIIAILAIIAALAFFNASGEGYSLIQCLTCSAISILALSIMNWIAVEVRIKKKKFSFTLAAAMILNCYALTAYFVYAIDGPSDQLTLAYMQTLTFPIQLAILCMIVLLPSLLIDFITKKK